MSLLLIRSRRDLETTVPAVIRMILNLNQVLKCPVSVFYASILVTSWVTNCAAGKQRIKTLDFQPTNPPEKSFTPTPYLDKVTLKAEDLKTEDSTKNPLEKKEAISKKITTTKTPEVTTKTLYRLNGESGTACILLRTDALVTITYTSRLKEEYERDIYVPESAEVDGVCSEDTARLELKWTDFNLKWYFEKTPGGERWFVDRIDLWFDASSPKLEHIRNPDQKVTLSTSKSHSALLFVTPVGQAYTCLRDVEIKLTNPKNDIKGLVLLRELEVQPFLFKDNNFGPEYTCPAPGQGTYRSETAPLIVGSLLAFACLATVTGYGIFRYLKIKKVQYDTME